MEKKTWAEQSMDDNIDNVTYTDYNKSDDADDINEIDNKSNTDYNANIVIKDIHYQSEYSKSKNGCDDFILPQNIKNEKTNEKTNEKINEKINEKKNEKKNEKTNEKINEKTNEKTNENIRSEQNGDMMKELNNDNSDNNDWRKTGELRKYSVGYKSGNADNNSANGYNANGYNANGCNANGYNANGYSANGYNANYNRNNNGDENDHQAPMCNYGVKCNNYYCNKSHPPGRRYQCKFGEKCNKSDCKFLHPRTKTNECKFGINCTNENCKFEHPRRKINWDQQNDKKETVKVKILQFWERHPETKPLNISLIERKNDDMGIGCRYCFDTYKHDNQYDCPCKWTFKIGKNNEIYDFVCQDCKSVEWIKVNSSYSNCLYDSLGCPYAVRLDKNGAPCKCIHPYGMCPYHDTLQTANKDNGQ
jgi:hypothetical protein